MVNKKELSEKRKMLENARQELKKEFFGIDNIIDEVCRIFESWLVFPEMQERPLVINLWGMTGVGKTALIRRLADLTGKADVLYRFDMADKSVNWSLRDTLSDVLDKENGKPMMVVLDEFQNIGKSVLDKDDKESKASRLIWEILDSGKFNALDLRHYCFETLQRLIFASRFLLEKGVVVRQGKVVSGKKIFINYTGLKPEVQGSRYRKNDDYTETYNFSFIGWDYLRHLLDFLWPKFKTEYEIREFLDTLNGQQTMSFLTDIFQKSITPKTYDCSKSVIFVIGNLDDAYSMSGNYNPDMSADDFHTESLKITRSDIKNVLSDMFRHEQIARLGNMHLIYPSLSSAAYKKIISEALLKISRNYRLKHGLVFNFSDSIHEMIYAEGVTPSLGVRPIQSTINQLVVSNLGLVINQMSKLRQKPDQSVFEVLEDKVIVKFLKETTQIGCMYYTVDLEISALRKIREDDNQAIVAVHEAGHAVIDIVLMKIIPDRILSRTADSSVRGFVDISCKPDFHSVSIIRNEIISLFGGIAAEEIIFGHEHVTAGSGSDLIQATRRATAMIRNRGMGSFPGLVNIPQPMLNDGYLDLDGKINNEVKELLQESHTKAFKIINENQPLLLALAKALNENACIDRSQILQLLNSRFPHLASQASNNDTEFSYRELLLRKCASVPNQASVCVLNQMPALVMNIEKTD